jgi:hypothetical protein
MTLNGNYFIYTHRLNRREREAYDIYIRKMGVSLSYDNLLEIR